LEELKNNHNNISGQTCEKCRNDIDRQLDNSSKRLEIHSNKIDDLKLISERLLILSEQNAELLKQFKEKQERDMIEIKERQERDMLEIKERQERDMLEIKENQKNLKINEEEHENKNKKDYSFWNTEAGKSIPKWVAIVIIFIVVALVGTNLVEFIKNAKDMVVN